MCTQQANTLDLIRPCHYQTHNPLAISSSVSLKLCVEFCSESATIGEIAKEPASEEECNLGRKKNRLAESELQKGDISSYHFGGAMISGKPLKMPTETPIILLIYYLKGI
jgi:hypothetical protein